jgi:hypothetical protein
VDYWDYLGWRDVYGSAAFSARQRAYAAEWRSPSVYTPGFVLDGKDWRGWLNRGEFPRASAQKPGVLSVRSDDRHRWMIRFESASAHSASFDFHAALLGSGLSSQVKAGENRGRTLKHDFVALAMASTTASRAADGVVVGEIALDSASRPAASRLAIAVWVTEKGRLAPLQATGGWLPVVHP